MTMELVALGRDTDRALEVAAELRGTAYVAEDAADRAFQSLVRVTTDDLGALDGAADLGLYVVYPRQVKRHPVDWSPGEPTPGVTAAFGLVRRPDLTHAEADAHWRDTHAPLALRHHVGMWDYVQCSVVATLDGDEYDGFALCSFATEQDLRERFFDGPEGIEVIRDDIAKFADSERSPRRVLAVEHLFGR